jgi:hypothetical protein
MELKLILTPDQRVLSSKPITSLTPNQIFVFGSNLLGKHNGGAAKLAKDKFYAKYGVGIGPTGQSYAIPTKSNFETSLTLNVINIYVSEFCLYAKQHPGNEFLVTEIGCGLAGYKPEDIAPMFIPAVALPNVHMSMRFWTIIAEKIFHAL